MRSAGCNDPGHVAREAEPGWSDKMLIEWTGPAQRLGPELVVRCDACQAAAELALVGNPQQEPLALDERVALMEKAYAELAPK